MKKITDDDMLETMMAMSASPARPAFTGARTISASVVGTECDAALAFTIRGFKEEDPTEWRRRVYDLGNIAEPMVITHMRSVGFNVMDKDPLTGKQWMLTSHEGHVKAYLDAWLLWDDGMEPVEIKTMNPDRFKLFEKAMDKMGRVAGFKHAEPKYYDQVQLIMHLADQDSGILIAFNKSDARYKVVRVGRDDDRIAYILAKIERVLDGGGIRMAKDPTHDFRCYMCGHKNGACTDMAGQAKVGCQRCRHATPDVDKKWYCEKHKVLAPTLCEDFEFWQPPKI